MGHCVVYDSVLVAYKQFPEVAFSTEVSQRRIDGLLDAMNFIIGGTSSSFQNGKSTAGI